MFQSKQATQVWDPVPIGRIKEDSDCLERICCKTNRNARFHMYGPNSAGPEGNFRGITDVNEAAYTLWKPFHCEPLMGCFYPCKTCFNDNEWCHPKLIVIKHNPTEGNKIIGMVRDPWACCYFTQE